MLFVPYITAFQDNKNTLTEEFELNRCLRKNILRQRNKIFTKHASTACQIHLVTCYNSNITTLVTKYFLANYYNYFLSVTVQFLSTRSDISHPWEPGQKSTTKSLLMHGKLTEKCPNLVIGSGQWLAAEIRLWPNLGT